MLGRDKAPIMYCGIPSRMCRAEDWQETEARIIATVEKLGYKPLIPFRLDCGSTILEDHLRVGRRRAFKFFKHILKCPLVSFGLFGISDGTMFELSVMLRHRQNSRELVRAFPAFDFIWDSEYAIWSRVYGDLLAELRGTNTLTILVGGSTVGKTYWTNCAIARAKENSLFSTPLRRVRTTTSRRARSVLDCQFYDFVSRERFQEMMAAGDLIEWDEFRDDYYGSSWANVLKTLRHGNGILALTPKGAAAFYELRHEINLNYLVLKAGPELIRVNCERRGITDSQKQAAVIAEQEKFVLPPEMPHKTFNLTGTPADEQILNCIFYS